MFELKKIRSDFPILSKKRNEKSFIYFDNAATTQKPLAVLETMNDYYTKYNSNVHRGVYAIAETATSNYESTRSKIQKFINAKDILENLFNRLDTFVGDNHRLEDDASMVVMKVHDEIKLPHVN